MLRLKQNDNIIETYNDLKPLCQQINNIGLMSYVKTLDTTAKLNSVTFHW